MAEKCDLYGHPICPQCGSPILDASCAVCAAREVWRATPMTLTLIDLDRAFAQCREYYKVIWNTMDQCSQTRKVWNAIRQWQDGQRCLGCLMGEHPN